MRVGIDLFTIRDLKLDLFGALDYLETHELAGMQGIRIPDQEGADLGPLKEVRAHADSLGLYTEAAVGAANPHATDTPREEHITGLCSQIRNAAVCGWHELHSWCGGPQSRQNRELPWKQQIDDTKRLLKDVAPELRRCGSRLNLEPKGGITTFEAVEIIEDVGPEVIGICLDTANPLCFGEHPSAAAERVAPYTHMTHCKDALIYFCDQGLRRQVRPPGQGVIDWPDVLSILARYSLNLTLSIEDHKWLFDLPIFVASWHQDEPGVPAAELCSTIGLAWRCQQRIVAGEITDPEMYEGIPYGEQMESRIAAARDHLNRCLVQLGLRQETE
jgi:sugar phosphate isomerase/epimerase